MELSVSHMGCRHRKRQSDGAAEQGRADSPVYTGYIYVPVSLLAALLPAAGAGTHSHSALDQGKEQGITVLRCPRL